MFEIPTTPRSLTKQSNFAQSLKLSLIILVYFSALKHLEYDVNVIEKEGRKLAKELDKVLNIR